MDAPLSAGRGKTDPSERKPRGGGGGGPRGGARSGGGGGGPTRQSQTRAQYAQVCYNAARRATSPPSARILTVRVASPVLQLWRRGHISADCPQPKKEREPRARKGDRGGYNEHDDRGGMAKPNRKEERACRICGKIGHSRGTAAPPAPRRTRLAASAARSAIWPGTAGRRARRRAARARSAAATAARGRRAI